MDTPDWVRADFKERVVLDTAKLSWIASPQAGVERRLLDRIGGEVARATSLVRYEPNSIFPPHVHDLGEEFLVLEGVFADEFGAYPTGTYVRNPPGSKHAPKTETGCVIFVKLRQMREDERERVVVNSDQGDWTDSGEPGFQQLRLFSEESDAGEEVMLEKLEAGAVRDEYQCLGGEEMMILSGSCFDEHGVYNAGYWVRNPDGFRHGLRSNEGCRFWVKRGHLRRER